MDDDNLPPDVSAAMNTAVKASLSASSGEFDCPRCGCTFFWNCYGLKGPLTGHCFDRNCLSFTMTEMKPH